MTAIRTNWKHAHLCFALLGVSVMILSALAAFATGMPVTTSSQGVSGHAAPSVTPSSPQKPVTPTPSPSSPSTPPGNLPKGGTTVVSESNIWSGWISCDQPFSGGAGDYNCNPNGNRPSGGEQAYNGTWAYFFVPTISASEDMCYGSQVNVSHDFESLFLWTGINGAGDEGSLLQDGIGIQINCVTYAVSYVTWYEDPNTGQPIQAFPTQLPISPGDEIEASVAILSQNSTAGGQKATNLTCDYNVTDVTKQVMDSMKEAYTSDCDDCDISDGDSVETVGEVPCESDSARDEQLTPSDISQYYLPAITGSRATGGCDYGGDSYSDVPDFDPVEFAEELFEHLMDSNQWSQVGSVNNTANYLMEMYGLDPRTDIVDQIPSSLGSFVDTAYGFGGSTSGYTVSYVVSTTIKGCGSACITFSPNGVEYGKNTTLNVSVGTDGGFSNMYIDELVQLEDLSNYGYCSQVISNVAVSSSAPSTLSEKIRVCTDDQSVAYSYVEVLGIELWYVWAPDGSGIEPGVLNPNGTCGSGSNCFFLWSSGNVGSPQLTVYNDTGPVLSGKVTASPAHSVDSGMTVTFTAPPVANITGGVGPFTYDWVSLPYGCASSGTHVDACAATNPGYYQIGVQAVDSNNISGPELTLPYYYFINGTLDVYGMYALGNGSITQENHGADLGQHFTLVPFINGGTPPMTSVWKIAAWKGTPSTGLSCSANKTVAVNENCIAEDVGKYNLTVTVTDTYGEKSSFTWVGFTVSKVPTVSAPTANPTTTDVGDQVVFTEVATANMSGLTYYTWYGLPTGCPSPQSSYVDTLNCTPSASGTYSVQVTFTDANHETSKRSTALKFVVYTALSATLTATQNSTDVYKYKFVGVVHGGSKSWSYLLAFGDGNSTTTANATHTYVCETVRCGWNVTLTVTDKKNGDTVSTYLLISTCTAKICPGNSQNTPSSPAGRTTPTPLLPSREALARAPSTPTSRKVGSR